MEWSGGQGLSSVKEAIVKLFGVTMGREMATPYCPLLVVLTLLWMALVKPPAPQARCQNFRKFLTVMSKVTGASRVEYL